MGRRGEIMSDQKYVVCVYIEGRRYYVGPGGILRKGRAADEDVALQFAEETGLGSLMHYRDKRGLLAYALPLDEATREEQSYNIPAKNDKPRTISEGVTIRTTQS
jgi:hypothetical protein